MEIQKDTILLKNEYLFLRPLNIDDITSEYIDGLNSPDINRYLVDVKKTTQTYESVKSFIESNAENISSILFGIFIKDDPQPFVGTVRVSEIDFFHYNAAIGICLFAKRAWKKGFAVKSIELVKNYLFKDLRLHYVEAGVYEANQNSINLFTRAGFSEWYVVREKFRWEEDFEETIFFAAINPLFDTSLLKMKRY
ncbi:MAG: GNAT family N-acetyltransferase [Planctomycetes bacterium]|nr:GNAT family N-acetyltransferase [Planctomycetota bacterium]